jgi:gliding motility-associated-like protein
MVAFHMLVSTAGVRAQGEASKWYFGEYGGLDFSSGNPIAVPGMTDTYEGTASISDAAGNLLFYTDGMTVWNRNHQAMPNGTGLAGDFSSTQSALIVPKPGSSSIYYVFTTDNQAEPGGLCYSEIDMTLEGGNGDVTANKNILLHNLTTERITAVRHCNNSDIWVISHDFGSNKFRVFKVTAAGVSAAPVLSEAGIVHGQSWVNSSTVGYMKASPTGNKLAIANYGYDLFELFDFDNSTGIVSNPMVFDNYNDAYGVEFSPDGTKLYVSRVFNPSIYQFNVCAGSQADIAASVTAIGNAVSPGGMQLGPDGKIYIVQYGYSNLDVIHNPNEAGAACNFESNVLSIAPAQGEIGLPNFSPYMFAQPAPLPVVSSTLDCLDAAFSYATPASTASAGCTQLANVASVSWSFGDPASGTANISNASNPVHTYSAAGVYDVMLIVNYSCYTDTVHYSVTVETCELRGSLSGGNVCVGSCIDLVAEATGGTPPYTYSWSHGLGSSAGPVNVCPDKNTIYTLTITDSDGASITDTALVKVNPLPVAGFTAAHNNGPDFSTEVVFTDRSAGAIAWSWSFGDDNNSTSSLSSPRHSYPGVGTYTVTLVVASDAGCRDTAYDIVDVEPRFTFWMPNAFTPNGDGLNDVFFPQGTNIDKDNFKMMIYNRWGELVYETDDQPWDGKMGGTSEIAQQDVYVWKVIASDTQKRRHEFTGTVNLVK